MKTGPNKKPKTPSPDRPMRGNPSTPKINLPKVSLPKININPATPKSAPDTMTPTRAGKKTVKPKKINRRP